MTIPIFRSMFVTMNICAKTIVRRTLETFNLIIIDIWVIIAKILTEIDANFIANF